MANLIEKGFPSRLSGPMAWTGTIFDGKAELYTMDLSNEELAGVEGALLYFKGRYVCRYWL